MHQQEILTAGRSRQKNEPEEKKNGRFLPYFICLQGYTGSAGRKSLLQRNKNQNRGTPHYKHTRTRQQNRESQSLYTLWGRSPLQFQETFVSDSFFLIYTGSTWWKSGVRHLFIWKSHEAKAPGIPATMTGQFRFQPPTGGSWPGLAENSRPHTTAGNML